MHSSNQHNNNPLKRSFSDMTSDTTPPEMGFNDNDHTATKKQCSSSSADFMDFNPRKYQLRVHQVAMKRNTIAVLDTETGKTMIAVMLIKDIGQAIKSSGNKELIIFLAPTVHLVNQQYEIFKVHTNFDVGEYHGAKGVDEWNLQCWEKETNKHDILVMTPQILLDALRKAFLSLETVCLMILDECYRATGNHPYSKIMKEFYHKSNNKPKIFGMTASPVVRKGVSSAMDCEDQISELESLLDSQIYTIEDRAEVEVFVPSAKECCRLYDQAQCSFLDLKEKMEKSLSKFDASLLKLQESQENSYKDMDVKLRTLQMRLLIDHAKILHCLDDLGLMCAYEAVKVCLENVPNAKEELEICTESLSLHKNFLEEVLCIFGEYPWLGDNFFLDSGDYLKLVDSGYISPKLHELLQLFQSFGKSQQILCLIFVERIVTAKVIERFVKNVACLAHLTVSNLTRSNTVDSLPPKMQKETLESFRSGKVNLLFATDVVEEGIHVPNCSVVVHFDLPKTVSSYVQSRGRAGQNNSQFVMLVERGNVKQRDHVFDLRRSEYLMTDTAITRDPDSPILKACTFEEKNAYYVDATGASVTADSSISLIHRYCGKLPADKYYTPKPSFEFSFSEGSCECKLTLPASAPFQTIVGPVSRNSQLAKQLVCLEACKKLHQMGALDDRLLPSIKESPKSDVIVKKKESASGAGTTKRKELHGTTCIRALSGSWGEKLDGAIFQAYKFDFSCNIVSEVYSGFVLLIESTLDDDVGNVEMDLYLVGKIVKASVSSCGQTNLNAEQMRKARCFQEFLFNGLFGRLFFGSKSAEKKREFLLQNETKSLWSPAYMYLLLPLETLNSSCREPWRINWTGIDSCASIVDFMKRNSLLGAGNCNGDKPKPSPNSTASSEKECEGNVIHFANGSFDIKNLTNMVVLAIHTGRIYSVFEVVSDSSAESPFDGNVDGVQSEYTTFTDYFNKKYGIVLMHPEQPLMRLKQSHNPHNLLVNFNDEGASSKASKAGIVNENPRMHVHIPPELLVSVDIPFNVLKSCYLLPSLTQRLESLMLASQLREEIDCRASNFHIASSLILEALTTLKCCETFSMERLELLGDSVLKYAVSCHLFLKYPKKHEGQLSSWRSLAVCNSTLYRLGTDRKLQGYIRDGAFDPRRWIAPGQRTLRSVPCKCGVDTLEVPLDPKFHTEDPKVMVGKCCDMGHKWMGSKTISDCVESLIGAYYVSGGLVAAIHLMKWLGIDAELEPSLVDEAINNASLSSPLPKNDELDSLESKLGYKFSVKFLLQEAITHASVQEFYCYQRLEFLGDSVLDLLITWHLYQSHTNIDPGELTDLRSASVNNENFAQVAVRKNLYKHLQHCSTLLLNQITEYVKSFHGPGDTTRSGSSTKGPKALGDLVESIVGAVLIDTKLNLDEVWRIFKPLLSPIVTPDKLELPPLRELNELCDSLGYFIKEKCISKGEMVHAELRLQLEDVLLFGEGYERNRKLAKANAASHLLKELQDRKISRGVPKRKNQDLDFFDDLSSPDLGVNACSQTNDEDSSACTTSKKQRKSAVEMLGESTRMSYVPIDISKKACTSSPAASPGTPVLGPINMRKGGPRISIFEFCKKQLWPMPSFKTHETKSRTLIEFNEGPKGFNSFVSKITLHVPKFGLIECTGDPRADKKSSFDSAALVMLLELEKQGKLIIDKP